MSKFTDLSIPETILEELRCSICKGYLSVAPIQVLPNGESICGHCFVATNDAPTYRQLALEAILINASFPCRFKTYGCKEMLPFGSTNLHEATCGCRPVACPSLPPGVCIWEGSATQIPEHILQDHQDLIEQNVRFVIEQFEDKQEVLMTVVNGVSFLAKCIYNSTTSSFCYHVQYFPMHGETATYNIRLSNDLESSYNCILKNNTCKQYSIDFYDMQNSEILFMDEYERTLNTPSRIAIEVVLAVKSNHNGSTSSEYFTFPISKKSWTGKSTMLKCDAEKTITSNYACRWPNCNFVGQLVTIQEHEMICEHCLYGCPFSGWCNDAAFTHSLAVEHLRKHSGQYFVEELKYKTWLENCYGNQKYFTLKYGRVILFCHLNTKKSNQQHQHEVVFKASDIDDLPPVIGKLRFEHSHCRVKSRIFILRPQMRLQIDIGDLPRCYRPEQQLTATLVIEKE